MTRDTRREPRPTGFVPFDIPADLGKCVSGKKILDEVTAKMIVANAQAVDNPWRPRIEKRAYACRLCDGGWHTTSEEKRTGDTPGLRD